LKTVHIFTFPHLYFVATICW